MNAGDFKTDVKPTWCPGCGDYGVLNALQLAAAELSLDPENTVVISGIGCSSNLPHFFKSYGIHSIHGRTLPIATGIKLANRFLNVISVGGDGDGYGIGLNHLIHAMRRNIDITYIVMNNQIYGLTTGQASPTSLVGHKTKSSPEGVIEQPVNPLALAITSGATYVARGFSGEPVHLKNLIKEGIEHKGFSLIDVFSPCVTFNKYNTYQWFRERVHKLSNNNTSDKIEALKIVLESDPDHIPLGVFYNVESSTYEMSDPVSKEGSLVNRNMDVNIVKVLFEKFC